MLIRSTIRTALTVAVLFVPVLPGGGLDAQQPSADVEPPRVFFDCRGPRCDFNYYRTEIDWVIWVRDQRDADVHILMTSQRTGAGGREFLLDFMGRGVYQDYQRPTTFSSLPTDTEREELDGITLTLGLGLAQFATASGFRDVVQLSGLGGEGGGQPGVPSRVVSRDEVDDPWDLWVFRVNASGDYEGQSNRREYFVRGGFNASRVSPTWIQRYSANYSRRDQRIDFPDRPSFTDDRYDWGFSARVVYALAEHFSVGFGSNVGRNTRNNQSGWGQVNPAIEYSFFPYEEATRRSLTAFYEVGPVYRSYLEETIFGETEELRAEQALTIQFSQRQPWGFASLRLQGSTYLHDLGANNTSLRGDMSFRVARGLELELGARYSRVRDQIYLPGEGLTQEERLLRLLQEQTDYEASVDFGLSYQFGSIFNNIVNNRF